jgi:type II secretory pathway component PulF
MLILKFGGGKMAKFSYRARRGDGKTEKGIIEALDREDLVRKLRSDNKFLIEAEEQKKTRRGNRIFK